MKKFLLLICFFLLGFALGKFTSSQEQPDQTTAENSQANQENKKTEIRQGGYKFISPLLECLPTTNNERALLPFKEAVSAEISKKTETGEANFISFYYRDLNNGPTFGINKDENFSPASLLKVPLMMAYFKKAEANPSILSQLIPYNKTQNSLETNVPKQQQLEPNKEYPVLELIERMITLSDNASFELLSKNIKEEEIEKVHRDISITVPQKESPENFISVQEYSSLFRVLYNASYLNRELSEKSLEILSKSTFTEGITAGLPENVTTSHKFGIRNYENSPEKQLHDCGIIYAPGKPYLLCIMTRGTDLEKLSNSIKDISSIVYEKIVK